MNKQAFVLVHENARHNAVQAVKDAPDGFCVEIKEASRTIEQNAAQWPYLEGFSQQLMWSVNGELCWLSNEECKDVLTAAFRKETIRLAQGVDGGVVMLGARTSKFSKKEFSEWIEYLKWFCAEKNITPVYRSYNEEVQGIL